MALSPRGVAGCPNAQIGGLEQTSKQFLEIIKHDA